MKKKILVVILAVCTVLSFVGCSGVSQEEYDQLQSDYDETLAELNSVKSENETLKAAAFSSESLDIVREKADESFQGSITMGYGVKNKEIINVLVVLDVNSDNVGDTTGFGSAVGTMLATGEIDCDYLYIDLVMPTGKKVYSLMVDSSGNMESATYE